MAVVKVALRNVSDTLEIASEFQPFQEIDVYAKVSGYIQKLYVDWGTHVKQGQLLAVLEIPELQQQLEEDQAAVHRSEQDLARAHEEVTRANSAYNVAHITYSRLADVQKTQPNLIAQQDIDVAQGKDLEANAGLSAAKDSVSAAEQELAASKAALEKDKDMYAYARITAPFDAVVTQMNAYTGALLPAGTTSSKGDSSLCRLSQNDLLRLVIPVPERAVASIHDGAKCGGRCVRSSPDVQWKNHSLLRPDRYGHAHHAHRGASSQPEIRNRSRDVCVGENSADRRFECGDDTGGSGAA